MGLGGGRELRRLRWSLPPPSRLDQRERRTAVAPRATRIGSAKLPALSIFRGSRKAQIPPPKARRARIPGGLRPGRTDKSYNPDKIISNFSPFISEILQKIARDIIAM